LKPPPNSAALFGRRFFFDQPSEIPEFRRVGKSLPNAIAEVERLLEQGDLLLAFDEACRHLERHPADETLKHRGVLAIARAGATERAARLFKDWGLDRSSEGHVLALEARIAKDRALKLSGDARRIALREAAALYRRIFEAKPDFYPAINWASLAFLAGDRAEARRVAETVLADPKVAHAGDYWGLATRAEANLLLDRREDAHTDLAAAAAHQDAGTGAQSSTRRQLRLILAEAGAGLDDIAAILAPLAPPAVLHVIDAGDATFARARDLREARESIGEFLHERRPGAIFTALAGPAEILFAAEAIAHGIELNIVLATSASAAERTLAAAGATWARRFRSCCRRAKSLVSVAEDNTSDDAGLSHYAARVAMGLALLRVEHLDGEAVQVILDGDLAADPSRGIRTWREDPARRQIALTLSQPSATSASSLSVEERSCCAVVFGDLPGFSKLPEKYLPVFWEHVMGAIGDVLGQSRDAVALKNTWGDAIHFVIPDVRRAAEICLAVQKRLQTIDGRLLGRDEAPTMRIGAHYGPVFEGWDPIAAQRTYYGRALSRAARIEPITPPGTVYVTEAFAAILLLESRGDFTCTYVGQVPLAKGYGTFRMYDLSAL
jgi:adenylate cyclase